MNEKNTEKNKLSDEELNNFASDYINNVIDDSVEEAKQNIKKRITQKKRLMKLKKQKWQEKMDRIHLMKIIENTPLGNVLMYYDIKQQTFCYQGPKNIPFKYLETVARKYVKIFNCKSLYIDSVKEIEQAKQTLKEEEEREKMKQQDKNESSQETTDEANKEKESEQDVFASFKNYKASDINKKSNIKNIKRLVDNNTNSDILNAYQEQQNKKRDAENLVVPSRTNRFTYKGKIDTETFFKKTENKIKLDFSAFKKMISN